MCPRSPRLLLPRPLNVNFLEAFVLLLFPPGFSFEGGTVRFASLPNPATSRLSFFAAEEFIDELARPHVSVGAHHKTNVLQNGPSLQCLFPTPFLSPCSLLSPPLSIYHFGLIVSETTSSSISSSSDRSRFFRWWPKLLSPKLQSKRRGWSQSTHTQQQTESRCVAPFARQQACKQTNNRLIAVYKCSTHSHTLFLCRQRAEST